MNNQPLENVENAHAHKDAEWYFLQCLCAASLPPHLRQEFCAKVPATTFSDLSHQIVFEEIRALSKPENVRSASDLREHLPARATARGFPDLEFEALLFTEELSSDDVLKRLQNAYQRLLDIK
jgi:hypothetical protein